MTTPEQLRAARAILGLTQQDVARTTGLSTMTIKRAEGSGNPPASAEAVASIRAALEAAGALFIDANGNGPGVALRR